jgi:hypothetical protein
MFKIISNKPWLIVITAFLLFVSLWVAFIMFAVKNQPPAVPLETHSTAAETSKDGSD